MTNPLGMTAIGDGLEAAATQLTAAGSAITTSATVVFTDGHETEPQYISDVTDLVTSRVFAIGLGTADQLEPVALDNLVANTGGYLLLTGNAGTDDLLLLQKYFAQVIAGVGNGQIVVDPDGFVPIGAAAEVPFDLCDGDTRVDAIILSRAADVLDVVLLAPDGSRLDTSNGVILTRSPNDQVLRLALPTPAASATGGTWRVRLKVNRLRLVKYLNELEERKDAATLQQVQQHGVAFAVTVQARSNVRLAVSTAQSSREPGGTATIMATLTDFGIPLAASADVAARVEHPDGTDSTLGLAETEPGRYTVTLPTPAPGVYRVLVSAIGATLHGERFTREELRTLAVWRGGDDRPPTTQRPEQSGPDLCELMRCLVGGPSLERALAWAEIDIDEVRRCIGSSCRDRD